VFPRRSRNGIPKALLKSIKSPISSQRFHSFLLPPHTLTAKAAAAVAPHGSFSLPPYPYSHRELDRRKTSFSPSFMRLRPPLAHLLPGRESELGSE